MRIAAVFIVIIMLFGCAPEYVHEVVPQYPVVVAGTTLSEKPDKIVSLSPVISYLISEFGYGDLLNGRTDNCLIPEELAALESVGSAANPDINAIIELDPDIVLTLRALSKKDLDMLNGSGVKVITLNPVSTISQMGRFYRDLGLILSGKRELQNQYTAYDNVYDSRITARFKGLVDVIVGSCVNIPKDNLFVYLDSLDGMVATPDTIEGNVFSMLAVNAADLGSSYYIEPDVLRANNPNFIFTAGIDAESVMTVDSLKDSTAAENQHIFPIDSLMFEYYDCDKIAEMLRSFAETLFVQNEIPQDPNDGQDQDA
ncbi:MAG: helical backbone metal receptor [Oscillospiraceae bacterium]|nr:helical backbone metal receptor [Oscillospiraceae bacterium]